LPGPQVPPRLHPDRPLTADGGKPGNNSERMLSVSGKKKCSHCKQELGKVPIASYVAFFKSYSIEFYEQDGEQP